MAQSPTKAPRYSSGPRPVKPDEEGFKRELDEVNNSIESIRASVNKLQESRNKLNNEGNDAVTAKRHELRTTIDSLTKKRNEISDKRNATLEQLKSLQAGIKKKIDTLKSSRDKNVSADDIDRKIATLEAQQQSGSLSLMEEKKIIAEISNLRKSKKVNKSDATALQGSVDADKKTVDDCRATLDAIEPEREEVRKALDEARNSLSALDEERKSQSGSMKSLYDERTALKAKLDAEFTKKKELQDAFRKKKDEYYESVKAERDRRAQEQEKRREEYDKQKLQREIEKVLESADIAAFSDEISIADVLIKHLTNTYLAPTSSQSSINTTTTSSKTSTASTSSRAVTVPDGAVIIKKKSDRLDEDSFIQLGTPKKSKGGNGKVNGTSSPTPSQHLKLDFEMISQFAKLKIDIPSSVGDVEGTVKTLEAKKKAWLETQTEETKKNKEKAEAKAAALRAKLSSGSSFDDTTAETEASAENATASEQEPAATNGVTADA